MPVEGGQISVNVAFILEPANPIIIELFANVFKRRRLVKLEVKILHQQMTNLVIILLNLLTLFSVYNMPTSVRSTQINLM